MRLGRPPKNRQEVMLRREATKKQVRLQRAYDQKLREDEMPTLTQFGEKRVHFKAGNTVKDKDTGKLGTVSRVCRRVVEVQFANEHEFMSGTTAYRRSTIHEHLERVWL